MILRIRSKGERLNWQPLNKLRSTDFGNLDIKGEKVLSKPSRLVIE